MVHGSWQSAGNDTSMAFRNVQEIADWRLCVGCGACEYACPERRVSLVDVEERGIRPLVKDGDCGTCTECLNVCPGMEPPRKPGNDRDGVAALDGRWGSILEVWEGHASDPAVRYRGSSGGAATAIAAYCLERERMSAVLHIRADDNDPLKNRSVISTNREELLSAAGSRYAPASPCDGLGLLESIAGSGVFVGKPCDVEGLRKCESAKDALRDKVGLAIGIFCAGTPARLGTLELLRSLSIDPGHVAAIRYRGRGWPGEFEAVLRNGSDARRISYRQAWGFIQGYRPYRCYLCPDGTAEYADLSCGDPWHRTITDDDEGRSLILVRTQKGKRILRGAREEGYIHASPVDPEVLEMSQKNLLEKKAALWGRLVTMKLFGIPTPEYELRPLFRNWCNLPLSHKLRSTLGTARRILQRTYWKPDPMKY